MTLKHWAMALFVFTISLALLVGCQSTTEDPFESLTAGKPRSGPNCPINQFEAREEGFRAMGSTGGMALNYPGSLATPVALPSLVSGRLNAIDDFAINDDVAILILDDFGGGNGVPSSYRLGQALFDYTHKGATPKEIAANLEVFIDEQIETNSLTHGATVFNHTLAILENMTGVSASSTSPDGSEVTFELEPNDNRVIVKAIETNNFDTLAIRINLKATIENLRMQGIDHFAVNMSFSIVPCEIYYGYKNSTFDSLEAYLLALKNDESGQKYLGLEEAFNDIANMVNNDPLKSFTELPPYIAASVSNIIYVASAGNYSLDFALAPGGWENVLSVASSNTARPFQQSSFSNDGELIAPGAWFTLTDSLKRNGVGTNADELVYAGTSFSDIPVTIFSALDLVSNGQCATPPLESKPALAYDGFENKRLALAIAELCP